MSDLSRPKAWILFSVLAGGLATAFFVPYYKAVHKSAHVEKNLSQFEKEEADLADNDIAKEILSDKTLVTFVVMVAWPVTVSGPIEFTEAGASFRGDNGWYYHDCHNFMSRRLRKEEVKE
jgi:hypothetical protein